jgi:hypothetical protein
VRSAEANQNALEISDKLEKMLEMIQTKPTESAPVIFMPDNSLSKEMKTTLIDVNQSLTKQYLSEKDLNSKLKKDLQTISSHLDEVSKDRDFWKEKAESPSRRIYKLPPELAIGSLHGYSSLVDQLIECMMDIKIKEKEIQNNRSSLERFRDAYSVLAANVQRLYIENQSLKKERDESLSKSLENIQKAEEERNKAVNRLKEYELLQNQSYTSADDIKKALIEAQRNLVVFKVNEEVLTRRYVAASESEKRLLKQVEQLKVGTIYLSFSMI